tara:strand:+ start:343 stop:669 length:327 start_codon:yes stop_codon:yes gene_type:complete
MKRLLLPLLAALALPNTSNASVFYNLLHDRNIYVEARCQDGKAKHYIFHLDEKNGVQILNLKGDGEDYFKYPELIPVDFYTSRGGHTCSSRPLTQQEIEAYSEKFKFK